MIAEYEIKDKFIVRNPMFKIKDIYNFEKIIDVFRENEIFRQGILLASNSLYEMAEKYDMLNDNDKKKVDKALKNYYLRSCSRTIPFGLFGTVGFGNFCADNRDNNRVIKIKTNIKVDSDWLLKVISKIEKDIDCNSKIRIIKNNTIKISNEDIRNYYLIKSNNCSEKINNISIKKSNPIELILKYTEDYIEIKELIFKLRNIYKDIDDNIILDLIKNLIDKDIVISELKPPINVGSSLEYVIDILEKSNEGENFRKLDRIKNLIDDANREYMKMHEDQIKNIIYEMKNIQESKEYLQINSIREGTMINISLEQKEIFKEFISLFYLLTPPSSFGDYIDEYKSRFISKYESYQEVNLLELIDEEMGIGYPKEYAKNSFSSIYKYNNEIIWEFLNDKYEESLLFNQDHIEITLNELHNLNLKKDYDLELLPDMEFFFTIGKEKNNENVYYLGPNPYNIKSQFSCYKYKSLFPKKELEIFNQYKNEIYENCYNRNCEHVNINCIFDNYKANNISQNSEILDYEINLSTNSIIDKDNRIGLDDIWVGIRNNRFYLKSKKMKKIIIPHLNSNVNYDILPRVLKLLMYISMDGYLDLSECALFSLFEKKVYVPRVQFKNIVISQAMWNIRKRFFSKKELSNLESFVKKFNELAQKYNIPRMVYFMEEGSKLIIDISNNNDLELLYKKIKKDSIDKIKLIEIEERLDCLENKYINEIVIQCQREKVHNSNFMEDLKLPIISASNDVKINKARDEWIFYKLYVPINRQNEFIKLNLRRLIDSLERKKLIEKNFFIRYADPENHIRLRLKSNYKYEVMKVVDEFLKDKKYIKKKAQEEYIREVERYGNEETIEFAESYFQANSELVFELLDSNYKNINYILTLILIRYLKHADITADDAYTIFDNVTNKENYKVEFNKLRRDILKNVNINNNFFEANISDLDNKLIKRIIDDENSFRRYFEQLHMEEGKNKLFNDKTDILLSLIHMFCNRLFGINRKREVEILTIMRHAIYAVISYSNRKKERYDSE